MKILGIVIGILTSIMGGYAFFMGGKQFVSMGWILGILFIAAGVLLLLPKLKELKNKKNKKSEPVNKMVKPVKVKKDNSKTILGAIAAGIGLILLCSSLAKTLADIGLLYLVGSATMFFGLIHLSSLTKKPTEEEQKPVKKKKKKAKQKEEKKEKKTGAIVCCVISLIIGCLAIYHSFLSIVSLDNLIAYNIVMQGVNVVLVSMDLYKKNESA